MFSPSRAQPLHSNPSIQLRDCQEWHVRLTCRRCRRVVALLLVQVGRTLNEPTLPLWRAAGRFRCRQCGRPPVSAELLSGVDDAASVRAIRSVQLPLG